MSSLPVSFFAILIATFLTDLLTYAALSKFAGLDSFPATLTAVLVAGLVALMLTAQGRRPALIVAALALLWLMVAALGVARGMELLGGGWPVKLVLAALLALVTPTVLRRLLPAQPGRAAGWGGLGISALAACALVLIPQTDSGADLRPAYAEKRRPPDSPLRVYHLGHSLVGRDMPAMLAQLSGEDYRYEQQLGWGTSLREHFEPDLTINGFTEENNTPRFRAAHEALASGEYDAFIMTEMVTLKDAIRYHDSSRYAAKWAAEAVAGNPDIQIFLYETWHRLDEQPEWLARLGPDLELWSGKLLFPASRAVGRPVYLIPAGQVMARLVSEVEATPGGIGGMTSREQLFAMAPDGTRDPIHLNDLGAYLVALTHYAVLQAKSPIGLPHALMRADGTPATALSPELAGRMQEIVWQVVQEMDLTGI